MPRPILIVEDDPDIAETLRFNLEHDGLATAATGQAGLAAALNRENPPALILLDLMLPGMSGIDVCRRLRRDSQTCRTPIIMLTARSSETDRIVGLDIGADDYITKPFSVKEVLARVRAVLRRVDESADKKYEDDLLTIDFVDMRVICRGGESSSPIKNLPCSQFWQRLPIEFCRATNCWITFGAMPITATRERSTCTSAGYARNLATVANASRLSLELAIGLQVVRKHPHHLTAILAFVERLEGGALDDKQNSLRFLESINASLVDEITLASCLR